MEAHYGSKQHDVLSKFPNADIIALRQNELYYVCQVLNADRKMSTADRLRYYHAAVTGLDLSRSASSSQTHNAPLKTRRLPQARSKDAVTKPIEATLPEAQSGFIAITQNCGNSPNCVAQNTGTINLFQTTQFNREAVDHRLASRRAPR